MSALRRSLSATGVSCCMYLRDRHVMRFGGWRDERVMCGAHTPYIASALTKTLLPLPLGPQAA